MAIIPNEPDPGPNPIPDIPPIGEPTPPIKEPEPDRLPDEEPNPNPDENDDPAKQVRPLQVLIPRPALAWKAPGSSLHGTC